MNKESEAWEEVKAYLEYCLELRSSCKAMFYTSTYDFLKPFIDNVDKQVKALKIIKEKRVDVDDLIESDDLEEYNRHMSYRYGSFLTQEEFDILKEVLL